MSFESHSEDLTSPGASFSIRSDAGDVFPHDTLDVNELDSCIDHCALEVWGWNKPLDQADRLSIAKLVYHLKPAAIHKHPKEQLIVKARGLLEKHMNSNAKLEMQLMDSLKMKKSDRGSGDVVTIVDVIDGMDEYGGDGLWGAASLSDNLPMRVPGRAVVGMDLASSVLGFMKTMKDGVAYLTERQKVSKLQEQSKKLKNEILSEAEEPTAETMDARKRLRQVHRDISKHQNKRDDICKGAKADAVISTAFFASSVTDIATDASAAVIASAAVGGIVLGTVMVGLSVVSLVENVKQKKALDDVDNTLKKTEDHLSTQKTKDKSDNLLLHIVKLKRDQIKNHQKKRIWLSRMMSGLTAAVGCFSIAGGVLTILAEAGFAIGAVAISATGIGLGVLLALGLVIGISLAVYKYTKRRSGLMPKITELQTKLLKRQEKLPVLYKKLSLPFPKKDSDANVSEYLNLNRLIEQIKSEAEVMKATHKINIQTKQGGSDIMGAIDQLEGQEIEDFLKRFKDNFKLNFPNPDLVDNTKEYLKIMVGEWVTAGNTGD